MSKTSYRWEQALVSILSQAQAKDWDILALSPKQVSKITTRVLLLLGIILLWWWNWKLLLATSVGIMLMLIVYTFKKQHWQRFYRRCQGWFTGYNRKLALAVGSGSMGAFVTYMTASIWADSENRWLATSVKTLVSCGMIYAKKLKIYDGQKWSGIDLPPDFSMDNRF